MFFCCRAVIWLLIFTSELPWWGFVLAMVIAAAWMIPIGMILAITVRKLAACFL
jgi:hypothetical protein